MSPDPTNPKPPTKTAREVAAIKGVTSRAIMKLCKQGDVPGAYLEHNPPLPPIWRIPEASVPGIPARSQGRPKKSPP